MDIQRFVATRKALGYSQKELSEGICTQTTLSRFENNGQIPTVKILIQLCNRLNLGLGELFPEVGVEESELNRQLAKAEFNFILREYQKTESILTKIDSELLTEQRQHWHYDYLKGYVIALQNGSTADASFYFNRIIAEAPTEEMEIFVLLAYTGMGILYENLGEIAKAEYFFNKAVTDVYRYPIKETTDIWRLLNILYYCGTFYANNEDYQTSDALLEHGVAICSDNHVTYYLARMTFQLAKNAVAQNKSPEAIIDLYYGTKAYAKINKNMIELRALEAFKQQLLEREDFKHITLY
ncbi:helix-turn-helix domain-containing protein [Enterococcus sp. LJL98]